MKLSKRRAIFLAFCITALCILLAAALLLHPSSDLPAQPDYSPSIAKAIKFFEGSREPYALLFLDVIYRRFGIVEFADALQRYDQVLSERPVNAPTLSALRRIADHDNLPTSSDLFTAKMQGEGNYLTIPALYCDQLGLPAGYEAMFEEAVYSGGYLLTHVLLAWIWIQENGCEVALPDAFIEFMYLYNAALIDFDPLVYDIELEAAAFLYLAGQGALVNDTFVERVITAQNADGSWNTPDNPDRWHATVLGLLLLLHVEFPADSYPPMLAPA
jgi:hypothetical protein